MIEFILVLLALLFIIQSVFTIYTMIYAWDDPDKIGSFEAPQIFEAPDTTFSIILPAWKEEAVIEHTILSLNKLAYPKDRYEVIVALRPQDEGTVAIANRTIQDNKLENFRVLLVDDTPQNKPNQLNWALESATGEVVTICDAEDEFSPDLLDIVNTVMKRDNLDVLQCGVQLMNFRSNWFATLNVLEYFYWFRSSLLLYSHAGAMPLGGNSIFLKKDMVQEAGGWNEDCLTEDAELGFKLSKIGARMSVMYDPKHATQEEVPHDLKSFIQQRSRWVQGFFQVFKHREWTKLEHPLQILLSMYILLWPFIQSLFLIYAIVSILILQLLDVSLTISLLSIVPLLLLGVQYVFLTIGLYTFTQEYKLTFPIWMPIKVFVTFFPYQFVLMYSSARAVYRELASITTWEKTEHKNLHRL